MLSLSISRRKDVSSSSSIGGGGGGNIGMGRGLKATLPVKKHQGKSDTTIQRTSASLLSSSSDTIIREIPTSSSTSSTHATSTPHQSQSTQLMIQSNISMQPRQEEDMGYSNLARSSFPSFSSRYPSSATTTYPFRSQQTQQSPMNPTNFSNIGQHFLPSWLREDDNGAPSNITNEDEASSSLRNLFEPRTIEEMSADYAKNNEGKSDDNNGTPPPSNNFLPGRPNTNNSQQDFFSNFFR